VAVFLLSFFTLALNEDEWLALHPGCFTAGERASDTHWIGGWVGPRGSPGILEKLKSFFFPGFKPQLVQSVASSLCSLH